MNDKEYGMKHIKALFKIGLRTNQPVSWKYIVKKAREYNIDKDILKVLFAEVNCGL